MNTKIKSKLFSYPCIILGLLLMLTTSCKKLTEITPAAETGSVTDIENNVYKTVKIGNQWWMAENLKVKKYRNGNPITDAQSDITWTEGTAAYCIYGTTAPGLLYNGHAVNDSNNIAPAGWHVPTDAEWKELEKHLGMSQAEADKWGWRGIHESDKLKIAAPQGWTRYGDVWATNESGFTALAGGSRRHDGVWADPGLFATGFWWTRDEHPGNEAFYRYMDYKNSKVFRSHCLKSYGFSIRCVKD